LWASQENQNRQIRDEYQLKFAQEKSFDMSAAQQ